MDPISSPKQSNLPFNQIQNITNQQQEENENRNDILWTLNFDGSCNKTSAGAGVWIQNTKQIFSYKLDFPCTNNIAEYESLLLGLQLLKQLEAQKISILGDSELIIRQIKGEYSAKHPRMKTYRNVVLDFLNSFTEYSLSVVSEDQNIMPDDLATSASTCKLPFHPTHPYTIEVKNRPIVPNNIIYWQVFGNDAQIENFLQSKEEFEDVNIDI